MKPRKQKATKAEKERYAKLKELGCIVTRLNFAQYEPAEIHHLTSGGRRIGNMETIPLSSWYHRAILPPDCKTTTEAVLMYGPSLETSKRKFESQFGSEEFLLAETNKLIGE
jgi:hypothetical protein